MNQPKKRGRPFKTEPQIVTPAPVVGVDETVAAFISGGDLVNPAITPLMEKHMKEAKFPTLPTGGGSAIDASGLTVADVEAMREDSKIAEMEIAQAYAERIWAGQSDSVTRIERIRRVKLALEGQGLPFEGVVL